MTIGAQPGEMKGLDVDYGMSGTGQQLPLMLCLDTSGSMGGKPIEDLNEAMRGWSADLRSDLQLGASVQVGVVTFGAGGVRAWRGDEPLDPASAANPFVPAIEFKPPVLVAGGVTLLTEAMELAIRHVNTFKGWLRAENYNYYRPLIFLITDGLPTDAEGKLSASWKHLVPTVQTSCDEGGFELWAIGVGHLKPEGEAVLRGLAPDAFRILGGFPFRSLLRLLSNSVTKRLEGSQGPPPVTTVPLSPDSIDETIDRFFGQSPAGH
jgi:uncharacterized protein YegL